LGYGTPALEPGADLPRLSPLLSPVWASAVPDNTNIVAAANTESFIAVTSVAARSTNRAKNLGSCALTGLRRRAAVAGPPRTRDVIVWMMLAAEV
jgi:hypothetical protein